MSKTYKTPADLIGQEGTILGPTDWMAMTQDRIDGFADATDDHQWIHVDQDRAKDGPFGTTIAHGYLTLALVNKFLPQMLTVAEFSMGVNYGVEKVRFPNPVKQGARLRGSGEIVKVEEVKNGGVQSTVRITVEIEGEDRPACIADTISRYYP
ncbi:MAG: MaoC family dehydratase [Alphaproteobacteria bacterium]